MAAISTLGIMLQLIQDVHLWIIKSLSVTMYLAPDVRIYTATHPVELEEHLTPVETPEGIEYVRYTYALPVTIGDGCWIGGGVIILPITIGAGSVISAGGVVTKNIPANCLVVGNPCKVVRKINGST